MTPAVLFRPRRCFHVLSRSEVTWPDSDTERTLVFKYLFDSGHSNMRIPSAGHEAVKSIPPNVDAGHKLIKHKLKTL